MTPRVVQAALLVAGLSLLALLGSAQAPLPQGPPQVADCDPKPFATNVDADRQEISVAFDRPMAATTGFVPIRFMGCNPIPRNTQPRWDPTGTICSVPVVLQPDVTYALCVNTSRNRGFTDQAGTPALGFTWVFATGERTDDQLPPRVVSSEPAFGATNVDFRLREVKVTFSRPVAPDDFSWVLQRGCGEYPGTRDGQLSLSEDRLTATMPVRLSPGTVYALSVNDIDYCGYKDTFGRVVAPYGLWFRTAN
jgi:Bacterial Ig-like domain